MKFAKLFQYAYLIFALLFIYDALTKWQSDKKSAYISIGLSVLAIFIYLFRRTYYKRFQGRNNQK